MPEWIQDLVGLFVAVLGLLPILVACGFLYLIATLLVRRFFSGEVHEKYFQELCNRVAASLRGYRDQNKTEFGGILSWGCNSKRFTFHVTLQREGWRFPLWIYFHCPVGFSFQLIPRNTQSWRKKAFRTIFRLLPQCTAVHPEIESRFEVTGGRDESTRRLFQQKEFPAILDRLECFDFVRVRNDNVSARKTFYRDSNLVEWPEALGGIITFVRFLLDFEQRRDLKVSGEPLCPYCRNPIEENQQTVSCRDCRTSHHQECWEETGRCSVFGCRSKTELPLRE